jgi:membrane protein implicated in regulation of membrane protease activity
MDALIGLGPWSWIIGGLLLMAVEVLAPGAFMLWLGLAAIATGLVAFVTPLSMEVAALVFAGFAIISVLIGRRVMVQRRQPTGEQALNDRGRQIVGRTFVLDAPIAEGRGRVRVDDTVWRVEGPDMPAGTSVRVTGVEGTLLKVAKAG